MTTVQTICTEPFNAVQPLTPAKWLYLESDCDGLSSDQVQIYSILTHLIWTTDVNVTRYRSCSVRRWFGEKPSATITEKTNYIYEMDVAQNMTDILLVSLVTELWVRLWWFSYLQISFEPPMSTLQGIDHAQKVKKSSIKHGGILSLERALVNFLIWTT
jgi:hypothetical protein